MPRFFFHVYDRANSPDQVGTELSDLETMQIEAVHFTGELLREQGYGSSPISPLAIEVTDEDGVTVLRVEVGLIWPSKVQTHVPPHLGKFLQ